MIIAYTIYIIWIQLLSERSRNESQTLWFMCILQFQFIHNSFQIHILHQPVQNQHTDNLQ